MVTKSQVLEIRGQVSQMEQDLNDLRIRADVAETTYLRERGWDQSPLSLLWWHSADRKLRTKEAALQTAMEADDGKFLVGD